MLERIGPWRLTGMAMPLAVWAVHFLAVYIMQGLACGEDWQRERVAGLEMVSWWLLLATVAGLALIASQGVRAMRCRRPDGRARAQSPSNLTNRTAPSENPQAR